MRWSRPDPVVGLRDRHSGSPVCSRCWQLPWSRERRRLRQGYHGDRPRISSLRGASCTRAKAHRRRRARVDLGRDRPARWLVAPLTPEQGLPCAVLTPSFEPLLSPSPHRRDGPPSARSIAPVVFLSVALSRAVQRPPTAGRLKQAFDATSARDAAPRRRHDLQRRRHPRAPQAPGPPARRQRPVDEELGVALGADHRRRHQRPDDPAQAPPAVANAAEQRAQSEPKLSNAAINAPQPSVPTNRYNMYNACYGLKSVATGRWLTRPGAPSSSTPGQRVPAVLQAHLARPLHDLHQGRHLLLGQLHGDRVRRPRRRPTKDPGSFRSSAPGPVTSRLRAASRSRPSPDAPMRDPHPVEATAA